MEAIGSWDLHQTVIYRLRETIIRQIDSLLQFTFKSKDKEKFTVRA